MKRTIGLIIAPTSDNNRGIVRGVLNYVGRELALRVDQRNAVPYLPWHELSGWQGDGLIVLAHTKRQVQRLARKGVPAVNVSSQVRDQRIPAVHVDNQELGRLAAEHLLALGLHHFAFVGRLTWPNHADRSVGFHAGLLKEGHECTNINIRLLHWVDTGIEQLEVDIPRLAAALAKLPTPVGVAAGNDLVAFAVVEACREIGARVPFDIAIIGNGNLRLVCESTDPPLSTVTQGAERIGYEAAALLDGLMRGDPPPKEPRLLQTGHIVARRSSEEFAVEDELVARVLRIIHARIGNPLTAQDIAEELPVTRRTLHTRFQRVLGHSVGEEIRRVRVRHAKELLANSDKPITEITYDCGFSNASGFVRFFRGATGFTPGKYRQQTQTGGHPEPEK